MKISVGGTEKRFRGKIITASTLGAKQKTESLTILQRIAKNDRTTVKNCVDTYGNLVWATVKKFTDSAEAAERAAQEIFIDIWRYAGRFDSAKADEINFIALITQRRLIEYSRKKGKHSKKNKGERARER